MYTMMQKNAEREKFAIYSDPITYASINIFSQKGKALEVTGNQNLNGYTLGVLGGSATEKIALKLKEASPTLTIVPETDQATVLKKLAAGRYGDKGVALLNEHVSAYYSKAFGFSNDIESRYTVETNDFYLLLSKKSVTPEMVTDFNKALLELKKNGEMKAIYEKWNIRTPR
jgi:polar amino acid transport system substrate-binding protein